MTLHPFITVSGSTIRRETRGRKETPADLSRNKRKSVNLNSYEEAALNAKVEASGMGFQEYCRVALLLYEIDCSKE